MTINVIYFAEPPQFARLGTVLAFNTPYLVGDRITNSRSFGPAGQWTYVCSVAGTSPATAFNPTGSSPYTWGTSTWTLITPNTWATAATGGTLHEYVNYIDSEMTSMNPGTPNGVSPSSVYVHSAIIFVRQSDSKPATGRAMSINRGPMFFSDLADGGYHARTRLGMPKTFDGGWAIDAEGEVTAAAQSGTGWRGVTITTSQVVSANAITDGVAVKYTYLNDNLLGPSSAGGAYGENRNPLFGVHVEHVTAGALYSAPTYPTNSRALYGRPVAYASDNATSVLPSSWGSAGGFQRSTVVYRNGAALAGDVDQSFQLGGVAIAGFATLVMSPFMFIHNKLTGARTLTLHFLTDSPHEGDINDTDIWVEVFYPVSTTLSTYGLASSENPNWGVPACAKTLITVDSAAVWTYSAIFFPTAYKIAISFTPNKIGMLLLRVNIASIKLSRFRTFICPFVDIV